MASLLLSLVLTACVGIVYGVDEIENVAGGYAHGKGRVLNSVGDAFSPAYLSMINAGTDPASGTFKPIGGVAMGRPCCVSWGPGRVDCFIRAAERSNILHWWKENGDYQEKWEDLGGIKVSNVECVSRITGIIDIMTLGLAYRLFVKTYTATTRKWTGWQNKGSRLMEEPSCVARTTSVIECMVRDGGNQADYITSTNGVWSKWGTRGGLLSYPSKTSRRSDTTCDYWHVGSNSNLWQTYSVSGKFGGWTNLGGQLRGKAEVVSLNPKRIDVMITAARNQLMHLVWNGKWQKWVDLGGSIKDSPSCVAVGTTIHCFMIGADSYLYRRSYDGNKWSGWFCSYGSFIESPSCVLSNAKEVSCYMRGFDGGIVEMVYKF